jgi:hypothetical protein
MTPREDEIAQKIKSYLDAGTAGLKPGIAYRLQQARARAVETLTKGEVTAVEPAFALAGRGGNRRGRSLLQPWALGGVLLIALAALFGWQQWQAFRQVQEFEELDALLLSSDLPIDAYLDRGFQNWLKTSFDR